LIPISLSVSVVKFIFGSLKPLGILSKLTDSHPFCQSFKPLVALHQLEYWNYGLGQPQGPRELRILAGVILKQLSKVLSPINFFVVFISTTA
jgi:hypothetical protein